MWIHDDPLHIPTRELRATLRQHLNQPQAFSIGTPYTLRAIVVPIPSFNPWDHAQRRRAFAAAKRAFALRLTHLRKATQK